MQHNEIKAILAQYHDPYLNKDILTAGAIKHIHIDEKNIQIELMLGYPAVTLHAEIEKQIQKLLRTYAHESKVQVKFNPKIAAHVGKAGVPGLANIKNIIAVGSGKGGVGKSTIAVNLALALHREGANVGLLDADIYGPSQPTMLGGKGEKPKLIDKHFQPIERFGMQSMSIGYLIDETTPMVWRGPMIGKAMQQLLHESKWNNLDFLVVDLPPGTGDIQLTLCQKIPVTGAIIVTTPQDLALLDVRRACEMFLKLNVPLLGIVENMSGFTCTQCGHKHALFGEGGGHKLAAQYKVDLLATFPLDALIREQTDAGIPPVVAQPNSEYAKSFCELARKTAGKLANQTKDYSACFPKIVTK